MWRHLTRGSITAVVPASLGASRRAAPGHGSPGGSASTLPVADLRRQGHPRRLRALVGPGGPHGALVLHGFTGCPQSLRGLAGVRRERAGRRAAPAARPRHLGRRPARHHLGRLVRGGRGRLRGPGRPGSTRWSWPGCRWAGRSRRGWPPAIPRSPASSASTRRCRCRPPSSPPSRTCSPAASTASPPSAATWPTPRRGEGIRRHPAAAAAQPGRRGEQFRGDLGKVACPVLIMTSTQDHVVEPANSDLLAEGVSGRSSGSRSSAASTSPPSTTTRT